MDIVWKKPWGYHCYHQQQYLQYRVVLGFIVQQRIPGTIQPVTWPGEIAINFHCSTAWLIFYDKIFMFQDFHDLKIKIPSVSYQNQTQNQTSETIWDHAWHGQTISPMFQWPTAAAGLTLPFWIGDMSSLQLKMAWNHGRDELSSTGICIKSRWDSGQNGPTGCAPRGKRYPPQICSRHISRSYFRWLVDTW